MSGGVDSSTAAALLKKQGFDVIGVTLQLWDYDSTNHRPQGKRGCCDISHQMDAMHVCDVLGIHHVVLDHRKQFNLEVVEPYGQSYLSGETPNPCVLCNSKIKWGSVLPKIDALECDYLATGHYAKIVRGKYGIRLEKSIDLTKDQSYALWQIPHQTLERTLLPLGNWEKKKIREVAHQHGFRNAGKPDSQEVCFIDDHYGEFLRDTRHDMVEAIGNGEIIDENDKVVGAHDGFFRFTVGQRKGLNIGDGKGPYYVVGLKPETNQVVVGDLNAVKRSGCVIREINWISFDAPAKPEPCNVKIRYNDPGVPGTIFPEENGSLTIRFNQPRAAVTPGQSAVWYRGKAVWGGGIISMGIKSEV